MKLKLLCFVYLFSAFSSFLNAQNNPNNLLKNTFDLPVTLLYKDTTICYGGDAGTLYSKNVSADSIVGWQYSTNATAWIDINNKQATYSPGKLTQTTFYRLVVKMGSGILYNSNSVKIDVLPQVIAGTLAGIDTISSGESAFLILAGSSGNIIKWQYSTSIGLWSDINNTISAFTTGPLYYTTSYRVVVGNSCSESYSNVFKITVIPCSPPYVTGGKTICSGTSGVTLVLKSCGTPKILKWQYSEYPFADIIDITFTNDTYISGSLWRTTILWAVIEGLNGSENTLPDTIYVENCSNIISSLSEGSSSVFPNPAKNIINLSAEIDTKYEIVDITGQLVLSGQIKSNNKSLDISKIISGIYFIKFSKEEEIWTEKLIVQ